MMTMNRTRSAMAVAVAITMAVAPANAQFFFGMPVYDGAVNLEQLTQTIKLVAQLEQLKETYVKVKAHYDEAMRQGVYVRGIASRYRHPVALWRELSSNDQYNKLGGWVLTANTGTNAGLGWSRAVAKLEHYSTNFGDTPASQRDRKAIDAAGMDLADAIGESSLGTVGRVRASGLAGERTIQTIEGDIFSDVDPDQTEAAQLRRMNSAMVVVAKQLVSSNQMLTAQAEMDLVRVRSERQGVARAAAFDAAYRSSPAASLDVDISVLRMR